MDVDDFWRQIELARAGLGLPSDAETVAEVLTAGLARLPVEEVVAFGRLLGQHQDQAYRWDLWAAAYVIQGGCSDDGFLDFRGWLIAQGREVWARALEDPDSLADLAAALDEMEGESMLYAAAAAFGEVTGDEQGYWTALATGAPAGGSDEPGGEAFDFDDPDQVRRRLPRLARLRHG